VSLKNKVKSKLNPESNIFKYLSFLYQILFSSRLFLQRRREHKFRKQCYKEFDKKISVKLQLNGIDCFYEAISPRNYYHLKSINNNENHDYFNKYLKKGDVVLDIGGHTGAWTIPYAKFVGENGFVYVFEPEKEGAEAIQRNIYLNNISNAKLFQVAITDKSGSLEFYVRPDKRTHSIFEETHGKSPLGIEHTYKVDAFKIDDLIKKGNIKQPEFIKLDVEGAELLALEGMRETLQYVRAIYIECHLVLKMDLKIGEPVELVSQKLRELGVKEIVRMDQWHIIGIFN